MQSPRLHAWVGASGWNGLGLSGSRSRRAELRRGDAAGCAMRPLIRGPHRLARYPQRRLHWPAPKREASGGAGAACSVSWNPVGVPTLPAVRRPLPMFLSCVPSCHGRSCSPFCRHQPQGGALTAILAISPTRRWLTEIATSSSIELECVFFSLHPKFGQHVENDAGLHFQFPRQLVYPDFLHRGDC